MRFLVDAQLPPALARWLADKGHEAEHVFDRGMASAEDAEIWSQALEQGAVVITKDEDFPNRLLVEGEGPSLIWVRLGNTRDLAPLRSGWHPSPGTPRPLGWHPSPPLARGAPKRAGERAMLLPRKTVSRTATDD